MLLKYDNDDDDDDGDDDDDDGGGGGDSSLVFKLVPISPNICNSYITIFVH
jgi:hypothetical protein